MRRGRGRICSWGKPLVVGDMLLGPEKLTGIGACLGGLGGWWIRQQFRDLERWTGWFFTFALCRHGELELLMDKAPQTENVC